MAVSCETLDSTFFLFTTDVEDAQRAQQAGVDAVIVDWERLGKQERQDDYDTEINSDTPEDAARLAKQTDLSVTVRINQLHDETPEEIRLALDCGADIIMLPMARSPADVRQFVDLVGGRASTFIQIETASLAEHCAELRRMDWDYAHIGLNDLKITGNHDWLWQPLVDGTIEEICCKLSDRPIGFGSVTVVGGGAPIPFVKLMQEMARLGCSVKILRRTFKREIPGRNLEAEMKAYRRVWKTLLQRSTSAITQDHQRLQKTLRRCRRRSLSTA